MKRILCVLLVLALAASFAFASGAQGKKGEEVAGEVTVTSWQWFDPGIKPFWDEFQPAFEKEHPNLKVTRIEIPAARYWDQIVVLATAGPAPDLIHATALKVKQFMAMDVLDPLDDHMDTDAAFANSYEAQRTFAEANGNIYAYITGARTLQMIYNKMLFDEAGISGPPTNPDEFYEYASKLTKPGENQFGVGLKANITHYEDTYDCVLQFPAGYGSNFVQDGKITTTDPNTIKGVDLYKKMLNEKLSPVVLEAANREILFNNKMAMYIDGPWIFTEAKLDHPDTYKNLRGTATPFENEAAIGGANHFLMIPKDAKNKAGAAEFIKMWNELEWQRRHCMITGLVVASPEGIPDEKVKQDPWFQAFVDGMETAVAPIPEGFETQASKFVKIIVEAVLDEIVSQNKPTREVMERIIPELEAVR